MNRSSITPKNTEFVILSFEGPDSYSFAGGLGVRVNHLSSTLASKGFRTHLFFIGDPRKRGEETAPGEKLVLHRWCQWISRYHQKGVYDGEDVKMNDYTESIPAFIQEHIVKPAMAAGRLVVVLGEEWHTAEAMCRLGESLPASIKDQVLMFWNANNTFSFERIDWDRLNSTTTITTVSRYMKHIMWTMKLNPLVIPNGIPKNLLNKVNDRMVERVRQSLQADVLLCKVGRWHPDKHWDGAISAVNQLKRSGLRTVLVARGGIEPYEHDVLEEARSMGLEVKETSSEPNTYSGTLSALSEASGADVVNVKFHLPLDFLRFLYRASDGVLANSRHEPFGIVGLETMAVGGIAFTGCTGEDYAIPFINSFVLETTDPSEIVSNLTSIHECPEQGERMRKAARRTARYFTWEAAVENLIAKLENQARMQGLLEEFKAGNGDSIVPTFQEEPETFLNMTAVGAGF